MSGFPIIESVTRIIQDPKGYCFAAYEVQPIPSLEEDRFVLMACYVIYLENGRLASHLLLASEQLQNHSHPYRILSQIAALNPMEQLAEIEADGFEYRLSPKEKKMVLIFNQQRELPLAMITYMKNLVPGSNPENLMLLFCPDIIPPSQLLYLIAASAARDKPAFRSPLN